VISQALTRLRSPVGAVLFATALVGVIMSVHWNPLLIATVPLTLATLAPQLVDRPQLWFGAGSVWATVVVVRRHDMEDHVYLYVAWLLAVAVSLMDRESFVDAAAQQGRRLITIVFGLAVFWKLLLGDFITGTALWTFGAVDHRFAPLMRIVGISAEATEQSSAAVEQLAAGHLDTLPIEVSTYTSFALVAVSVGVLALEALISVSHFAADRSRLARLRVPALGLFGLVTYGMVPVLSFAMLLALMGSVVARFERRSVAILALMVTVAVVRFVAL
jgi:hypothetical protein